MPTHGMTKLNAINEGRSLLQRFGLNGFSFQHLADKLGLKKPSLYVHFETKEDFAQQLLKDYKNKFEYWTQTVEGFEPDAKLGAWLDVFYRFACDESKYCLINAFASDFNTLPKPLQKNIREVFDERSRWLEALIVEGQKKKIFRKDISARVLTELVLALGFGAQQVARLSGDAERIKTLKKEIAKILAAARV